MTDSPLPSNVTPLAPELTETGPVRPSQRIEALDVLRGLAILGILVVNVQQMFLPFFYAEDPIATRAGEVGWLGAWFVIDAFFDSKFLTTFSLLFGAGFCLQWMKAERRGTPFRRIYLRRIAMLILFGIVHGVFFYLGDVLVIYGLTALVMMPFRKLRAKTLLITGAVLLALLLPWHAKLSSPASPEDVASQKEAISAIERARAEGLLELDGGDFRQPRSLELQHPSFQPLGEEMVRLPARDWELPLPSDIAILILDGNDDPEQAKVEWAVFAHGPVEAAIFWRTTIMILLTVLYNLVYLGWRTLALFMIGAALMKLAFYRAEQRALWARVAAFSLMIGVPMTVISSTLRAMSHGATDRFPPLVAVLTHDFSALVLAAGLACGVFLWCADGLRSRLHRGLAAVGRTALTNYLGQSVTMSLLATSYGLGLFGALTRLQLLALALGFFVLQVAVSSFWLSRFRAGPLEWLWRCFTYWKWLPVRKGSVRQS